MKFGILIQSNDPETAWNAFRFSITCLKKNHQVKIFLMSKGVESISLTDSKYNVKELAQTFSKEGGILLACGTCLKSRELDSNDVCPISTMNDCLEMVEWADKTITF